MKVSEMKHLCNFCIHSFPGCKGENIEFGIDVEPDTEDADKVITCDKYEENK